MAWVKPKANKQKKSENGNLSLPFLRYIINIMLDLQFCESFMKNSFKNINLSCYKAGFPLDEKLALSLEFSEILESDWLFV